MLIWSTHLPYFPTSTPALILRPNLCGPCFDAGLKSRWEIKRCFRLPPGGSRQGGRQRSNGPMVQWSAKNLFESPVKAMFLGGVVDILLGGMHDADDIYPFGKYWQILANIGKLSPSPLD